MYNSQASQVNIFGMIMKKISAKLSLTKRMQTV